MTGEANSSALFNEPATRRGVGAAQPEGLHGFSPGAPRRRKDANLSVFWWGEAPLWPYDFNEAADVLTPKIC